MTEMFDRTADVSDKSVYFCTDGRLVKYTAFVVMEARGCSCSSFACTVCLCSEEDASKQTMPLSMYRLHGCFSVCKQRQNET